MDTTTDSSRARGEPADVACQAGLGPAPPRVLLAAGLVATAGVVAALLLAGGRPEAAPAGLPDPGAWTAWGSRLARLAMQLTGILTTGCLLTGAFLVPSAPDGSLGAAGRAALLAARACAAAWGASAALHLLFTAAETVGVPVLSLAPADLAWFAGAGVGRSMLGGAAAAVLVLGAAPAVRKATWARGLGLAAVTGLVVPSVAGHASSSADPEVASAALAVHVAAAAAWVGGLAGVLLLRRRVPDALGIAVPRFSALALGAFLAVGGSGLLVATAQLGTAPAGWLSGYGAVLAAKAASLGVLGVLGLLHRRRTLPLLLRGASGAFWRLAAVELVLMGAAAGMAAALARTPVPVETSAVPSHGLGHATLPASVPPISAAELLTTWRSNAVVLLAVCLAGGAYVSAVRRVRRAGRGWARRRTVSFLTGLAVASLATSSGVALYAPALVSVHLAQFLVMLLAVPALLTAGSPVDLWLAGRIGEHEPVGAGAVVLRLASEPLAGAALVAALVVGVFRTPLVELSLRSAWLHLAVLSVALVAGAAFLSALRVALRSRRGGAEPVVGVAVVSGVLAQLAYQLRYGDQLLAGAWFRELRWGWVDPVDDQRVAGILVGVALLVLTAGFAVVMASAGVVRIRHRA